MATVLYSARALGDVLRLTKFLHKEDPVSGMATAGLIRGALAVLEDHPIVGRKVEGALLRELVISRGQSGYLALYSYDSETDEVMVHAIRHQREMDFEED